MITELLNNDHNQDNKYKQYDKVVFSDVDSSVITTKPGYQRQSKSKKISLTKASKPKSACMWKQILELLL